MGYGSFHTHTRTRTHIHKYINMQPVPLSACSHQQRGHRRLKKQRMRLESEAPWRTCSGRVEDEKSKKEKEKKKEGKEEPLYPFYGPVREGKGFWVTPCRKGGGGREGSPLACR